MNNSKLEDNYNKWADWTMRPPKRSLSLINYATAIVFTLAVGVAISDYVT
jgi:hypothetical protein